MSDEKTTAADGSSNTKINDDTLSVNSGAKNKIESMEKTKWNFISFPSVAVLSLLISFLSVGVSVSSVYYEFFYNNSHFIVDVSTNDYLTLNQRSFSLGFNLFDAGNRSLLVQNIGIVELINQTDAPSCLEQQVAGALRTEILEGTTNGMIVHQLVNGTQMFIPRIRKYLINSVNYSNHNFIIRSGNAATVTESYDVKQEYSTNIKGISFCPYFSYALMNGNVSTIICSKFSLSQPHTPGSPRQINFINGEISIIPKSPNCMVVEQET